MKTNLFIGLCYLSFFIGCQSKENNLNDSGTGQGIISFYTGEINSSSAIQKRAWPDPNFIADGYMYLKKIEISTTGKEWITLVDDSVATSIRFKYQGELIKIPIEGKTVPEGEYHGLRISVEPKIRILNIGGVYSLDTVLDKQPIATYVRIGMSQLRSSVDTLEFTSANGFLIPFTIEEDTETRIILHFIASAQGDELTHTITDWWFDVEARATRFVN